VTIEKQEALWKNIAMFLAGVVVSLMVMWATYIKNTVTREEMERYVGLQVSGMTGEISALNKNVIELKEATAALKAELAARNVKR
jgi:hypothetical protein